MKMTIKNRDFIKCFLLIVFIAQMLFLCHFNLAHTDEMNDYDASGAYVHILEISESNSLFPEFYHYATTMDIDSTVAIAAVLFKLTGNIFLAQGICNIFIMLIYTVVLYGIFKRLNLDVKTTLAMLILYFIPYTAGMLGYASMQFINVAPNTIRNFIPLLYFLILLDYNAGVRDAKFIFKSICVVLLMLLTSISASFYVLAFGILGMIAADVLYVLFNDDVTLVKKTAWPLHVAMILTCGVGMIIQKSIGFASKTSSEALVTVDNAISNSQKWFIGFFELFGGIAYGQVGLMSPTGIAILLRFVMTCLVLFSVVYYLFFWIKNRKIERHIMCILCVCVIDACALNLLATTYGSDSYEYRYHIMPILLAMILLGHLIDTMWTMPNQMLKKVFPVIGCIWLAAMVVSSDGSIEKYAQNSTSANELKLIDDLLEENDVKTAIVYGETNITEGRKLRAYGDKVHYIVINPEYNAAPSVWGGSSRYLDNADMQGKTAVITEPSEYTLLDERFKKDAEFLTNINGKDIYLSDTSFFDFQSGVVENKSFLVDYPYTSGYGSDVGSIQKDGSLITNGHAGFALWGPGYQGVEGTWKYTLAYEVIENTSGDTARFEVWNNGEAIASTELDSTNGVTIIDELDFDPEMHSMENRVIVPEGMVLRIKSITMEKVENE